MERKPVKLEIRDIGKYYDGHRALDQISFSVEEGEFLSILGPSGCGKTTLLRILIGLLEPDAGSIWKDGGDITKASPADRGMGIVFQNYALFENMTVLGNVEYALKVNRDTRATAREQAMAMLKRMGLEEHANKKPRMLSGGQQQRVAIARTMVLRPSVLLLDEPMSALDVETRLALRREIKELQKEEGITIIYITHDQEEAFAMSDRIMVMKEASIEQLDTPRNLIDHPANDYVQKFVVDNLRAKIDFMAQYLK